MRTCILHCVYPIATQATAQAKLRHIHSRNMQVRKKKTTRFTQPCRQSKSLKYNKMRIRKNIIILSLAASIAIFNLSSCGPKELHTDYIDQRLKDYCIFQEGSYWVYQNEIGDIDSLYLFQREDFTIEDDDRNYESIDLRFTSSHYPADIFGMAAGPFVGGGGHLSEYWDKLYLTPMGGFFYFSEQIDTPGLTTEILAGTEETYTAYFETLLVGDSTYKEVRQYDFRMGNLLSRETIYWAKGIGRVKYIDSDSTIWNIIKYKATK